MKKAELKKVVEAILFYSKKPVSLRKLTANLPDTETQDIRDVIQEIRDDFEKDHGFTLQEIAGGYTFLTKPDYSEWIEKTEAQRKEVKLSSAAVETLALVAFKQPVTRAEVEVIRGVGCSQVINKLIEKKLVTVKGRSEELGAPLLYGTTKYFLEYFGLNSIRDLPKPEEL